MQSNNTEHAFYGCLPRILTTIMLFVAVMLLASCRQTRTIVREVPVEVPVYHNTVVHDTVRETVERWVFRDGDTVRKTVWRDRYRSVHDTVHDSVAVPVYLHDTVDNTDHAALAMAEGRLEEARKTSLLGWLAAAALAVVVLLMKRK